MRNPRAHKRFQPIVQNVSGALLLLHGQQSSTFVNATVRVRTAQRFSVRKSSTARERSHPGDNVYLWAGPDGPGPAPFDSPVVTDSLEIDDANTSATNRIHRFRHNSVRSRTNRVFIVRRGILCLRVLAGDIDAEQAWSRGRVRVTHARTVRLRVSRHRPYTPSGPLFPATCCGAAGGRGETTCSRIRSKRSVEVNVFITGRALLLLLSRVPNLRVGGLRYRTQFLIDRTAAAPVCSSRGDYPHGPVWDTSSVPHVSRRFVPQFSTSSPNMDTVPVCDLTVERAKRRYSRTVHRRRYTRSVHCVRVRWSAKTFSWRWITTDGEGEKQSHHERLPGHCGHRHERHFSFLPSVFERLRSSGFIIIRSFKTAT